MAAKAAEPGSGKELDTAAALQRFRDLKPKLPDFTRIKIISMGDGDTGKTCLIKRYCVDQFVSKYISTIGVDFGVRSVMMDGKEVKVNFWDLSGHPEFFDVRNEFYKDTQGALLVYDVCNKRSFDSLDKWVKESQKYGARGIKIVMCANKADCTKRAVSEKDGRAWAVSRGFQYFETSASSGKNVKEAFECLFAEVVKS